MQFQEKYALVGKLLKPGNGGIFLTVGRLMLNTLALFTGEERTTYSDDEDDGGGTKKDL
jgi:hypothetical protein